MKFLWTMLALTLPFFSVQWGRLNDETIKVHMAPPMMVMTIIFALGFLLLILWKGRLPSFLQNRKHRAYLIASAYLLFLWYLISALRLGEVNFAIRDISKIGIGILSLLSVLVFFPRDKKFLERFWIIATTSSAALMCLLIYKYAIVFKVTTLGTDLDAYSIVGKNQLAGFLVWIIPYSILYLWGARRKLFAALPLIVLLSAWIYSGSRGGWAGLLIGLVFIVPLIGRMVGATKAILLVVGAVVVIGVCFFLVKDVLFKGQVQLGFVLRLLDMIDPNVLPNTDSIGAREELMKEAWAIFLSSPIIGVGLTQTGVLMNLSVHNSYISILTDMGLVGLGLFFSVILCIFAVIFYVPLRSISFKTQVPWVFLGSVAGFVGSLVFMNTMDRINTTTSFWVMMGFTLLASDMQKQERISETPQ